MSEEPRKRSRFDQEPEPARKTRFDRRSASPSSSNRRASRSRSPLKSPGDDAAAKAAEAAARINAQLQSKKAVQHVDVPPIRPSPSTGPGAAKSPSATPSATLNNEIYQQDGDFIKDIEVNDLRNRYTLTKGSTQKMIKDETGADVTTRGSYYPDKALATAANPPLYLHVTSTSKDGLEKAVAKIEELMKQDLPNLIDERRFRKGGREERDPVERDHMGRRKWPDKRIPVDLEPIRGFNLRAQVVGVGGSYVKHIQQETRCRVQIKGRGSGFMEHDTGRESDEQMYLHVSGPEQAMVDAAEEMCVSLLESVREAYEAYKERGASGPSGGGGGGGGGFGRQHNGDQGGYGRGGGDRHNSGSYGGTPGYDAASAVGYGQGSPYAAQQPQQQQYVAQPQYGASVQSPVAAAPAQAQAPTDPAEQQKQYEAWAQFYASNPSSDPYAAYGGYAAVMAQYMQAGYATQTPQAQYSVPPPPPDDGNVPPPPPPGAGYNAVPPPPGI